MGLESATYISELVATNPVGATDPKSQGDDHLRLIKAVLLATFPNINGPVSATDEDLSLLANGAITAGRYTPTTSNLSGLNTVVLTKSWLWIRVANIVFVIGEFLPGASNTSPSFNASLPVARSAGNFNSVNLASGLTVGRNDANTVTNFGWVDSVNGAQTVKVTAFPGVGWANWQYMVFGYSLTN